MINRNIEMFMMVSKKIFNYSMLLVIAGFFASCRSSAPNDKKKKASKEVVAEEKVSEAKPAEETPVLGQGEGTSSEDGTAASYPPGVDPQHPWNGCGSDRFCAYNGQYSYPTSGQHSWYNDDDLRECVDALARNGFPVQGGWYVQNRELSIAIGQEVIGFSDSQRDGIIGPRILMLKTLNFGTVMNYNLTDPYTLYCVKSNSKLSIVTYSSCYPNNVAFVKNKRWGAVSTQVRAVNCPYVYQPWYGGGPSYPAPPYYDPNQPVTNPGLIPIE